MLELKTLLPESDIIPAVRPDFPVCMQPCWFGTEHATFFQQHLPKHLRLYVELGSFLGASAGYVLENWPTATVVAIDHFFGSSEHAATPEIAVILPNLFERFCSNLWDYRSRLRPLRMFTLDGLRLLADRGIVPDVIYVDAAHASDAVFTDTHASATLFPETYIFGDDWRWPTVQEGACRAAAVLGRRIHNDGILWWLE